MFFANEENRKVLAAFIHVAEPMSIADEVRKKRLDSTRIIVDSIRESPEDWDERCSFNIKHIGNKFLGTLKGFNTSELNSIDSLYFMSYRFLCEFDFFVGAEKELTRELRKIKNDIQYGGAEMNDRERSDLIYASYVMPANIVKDFLNNPNVAAFKDFEQKKSEVEKLKEQWDKELEANKTETDNLKDKLEEYKTGFNFVGLYQGFSSLLEKKKNESRWLLGSLIVMGCLVLTPVSFKIFCNSTCKESLDLKLELDGFIGSASLISMEIILIYFFRVILLNHRSVKTQIMQIELRQTLCQFIQSYADYSATIKKQDTVALEKFENLVFSGLLSDPEKLPSTFDGLKQIGDFIKTMKGS